MSLFIKTGGVTPLQLRALLVPSESFCVASQNRPHGLEAWGSEPLFPAAQAKKLRMAAMKSCGRSAWTQ